MSFQKLKYLKFLFLLQAQNTRKPPADRTSSSTSEVGAEHISCTPDLSFNEIEELPERSGGDSEVLPMEVSPEKSYYKNEVQKLSNVIINKNKQIKVLQQKVRRFKKRLENLNALFVELKEKKLMDDDALDVLKTVSSVNEEFLSRQLASVTDEPTPRTYSPELRSFALTLQFYSTAAYDYVRKTFNLALPDKRTLARWYQQVDGDPGFTKEAFKALLAKIEITPYPLFFSLVFDEMAIRQHIEYDGNKAYGHVNIGADEEDDSLPIAKDAFVLLVVCINEHWKLPIGYFLTDSMNSGQRADLLKESLMLLHDKKCNVVGTTFDGLSANLSMMKQLGCCYDLNEMKTTFPHPSNPSTEIAIFLDPSHMLKLVRNAFGDRKCLFSDDGPIEWKFIEALLQRQD